MSDEEMEIEALRRMMETDGWTIFIREQRAVIDSLRQNSWDTIKTMEQLSYMKGFLAALEPIANFENKVDAQAQLMESYKNASV